MLFSTLRKSFRCPLHQRPGSRVAWRTRRSGWRSLDRQTHEVRRYGDTEGLAGIGTTISGLMPPAAPASVAAEGIVASLYAGPVMVARPGIGEITVALPKASMAARALAVELQAPLVTDVPKEEMAGGVAPGRGCAGSIPVVGSTLLASKVMLGAVTAIPAVAHVMIEPMALPGIGPKVPALIVPKAGPGLAPTVGIVPGTAAGDVAGMAGDVMRIAGALRTDVDLTCCAKVELQPNKTMAAVIRAKLRIGASCV
jgi:hypothetical protein